VGEEVLARATYWGGLKWRGAHAKGQMVVNDQFDQFNVEK